MLESFISTQKTSVQKAMTKRFRHYLSHAQDLNDLILHALQVRTGLCHSTQHMLVPWEVAHMLQVSSALHHTTYECCQR